MVILAYLYEHKDSRLSRDCIAFIISLLVFTEQASSHLKCSFAFGGGHGKLAMNRNWKKYHWLAISLLKWAGQIEYKDKDVNPDSDKYLHVMVLLFMSSHEDVTILKIKLFEKIFGIIHERKKNLYSCGVKIKLWCRTMVMYSFV